MSQAFGFPLHISANGTHVPLQGRILLGVTVNRLGGAGNMLTIRDGGVPIALVDTATALGTFLYDLVATNGLDFVLAGGATPADLTVTTY